MTVNYENLVEARRLFTSGAGHHHLSISFSKPIWMWFTGNFLFRPSSEALVSGGRSWVQDVYNMFLFYQSLRMMLYREV